MTADFKSFAPSKDKTVTVTRKLTLAERKAEQAKSYSGHVANSLAAILDYNKLKPIHVRNHGTVYTFSFKGAGRAIQVTVEVHSWLSHRQMLESGTTHQLQKLLFDCFNLCFMARLLKLANKQIADTRSLKGNKPQRKLPVKQKVVKKTELEMFAEEFKKLQAKYPDVTVASNSNGYLMAYAPDTLTCFVLHRSSSELKGTLIQLQYADVHDV